MKKSTRKNLFCMAGLFASLALSAQSITGVVTQPCGSNGVIAVTVTGMTPPIAYTYQNWTANQNIVHSNVNSTSDSHTGIEAYWNIWGNPNVWNVSAFDGVNTVSTTFTIIPPFTLDSVKVIPANCPAQSTVQAVNINGGTTPYSIVWTNSSTNNTYNGNPTALPNGNYRMNITDGAGCTLATPQNSASIYVQSSSPIVVNITGSAANCANGTATAVASGGATPYSYLWSNNATSSTLSGLTAQWLTCTVTDNIGCTGIGYYSVQQAVSINYNSTITQATCVQNNGAITSFVSGGTGPYTYLWSNNATTANLSNLTGNMSYQVQITDANGCKGQGWVYVGASTPISVTFNSTPSACTSATGSSTLTAAGGTTPYTYLWYTWPTNTTGSTLSNKISGNYSFKVTDAAGCIQTGSAFIPPVSTINAMIPTGQAVCPATTGNLSVYASGSNPPLTYAWSNLATTTVITNVSGVHTCTITDANGCKVVKSGGIIQVVNMNIGMNTTNATCLYSNNGSATANATGGTSPYTYLWSNSQTGATATNLLPGYYGVTVTDANGCSKWEQAIVGNAATSNTCYCTITGTIYNDLNGNCVQNTGEAGIANLQVHVKPFGYVYTNSNGVYAIQVPSGTYTVSESPHQYYPLTSCQTNNQVINVTAGANCVNTVNFGNSIVPISDLHLINTHYWPPIPGNSFYQTVIVQNIGTITESSIKVGYEHDGQLGFSSSTPWTFTQQNSSSFPNWYSITSGFPTLSPNGVSSTQITYNVPTNIPINTNVFFEDSVAKAAPISTNWLADNTPWNNVDLKGAKVVGSYDPNFKEVTPKGVGATGDISTNDSLLTYVVHFQNTGTYFAQNVVVVDTIDSDLNLSTLKPGYSDHTYRASISENGVLKFSFDNINLPWKAQYGDLASSGLFVYTIKQKKNLTVGTQIKNSAAIYFDYNEPIITNTTLNTIAKNTTTTSVTEFKGKMDNALLFPNPTSTHFNLVVNCAAGDGVLRMYDISGREVSSTTVDLQNGINNLSENCAHLQSGIYFVELSAGDLKVSKKLVISR